MDLTHLIIMGLLIIKHFYADFQWQTMWMVEGKGKFGHLGGIVHSGIHAFITFGILIFFTGVWIALMLSVAEFIAHYVIDWSKMNLDRYYAASKLIRDENEKPTHREIYSNTYYTLMGIDQCLHFTTYVLIVFFI